MENNLDMDISQLPEETKKRVDKERRKGEKKMEQFMKSIQDLSPDEKISALCKKNAEFLEDIRTYKGSVLVLQRKTKILQKEKELLENEHSKSVLARSRLENLCRELQRQNKSIKDESLQKIREEEEKRKEVSSRFQTSLNEVSQMMQQNTDKNLKLREDNIEISNKFQKLCDQFRQREEEVTRLTKQMSLEKQLAEATLKRIECQLNAEREIWNKEKEQHAEQLKYGAEERAKLEVNLKNLEEHLAMYSKKYEEFESTIVKSNQVFDSYKTEMSRMTKQINRLEKDCNVWKDRWQLTQTNLNKVMNDNQVLAKDLADREKKLNKLAALCRLIQEERTVYLKQLKGNGITPNKTTVKLPIPSVNSDNDTKKEELEQLKSEMSALKLPSTDTEAVCEKSVVSNSDNSHKDSNSELSNKLEVGDNVVADRNIPHTESDERTNVPESDVRTNDIPEADTSDVSPVTTLVEQTECVTDSLLINSELDQVENVEGESSRENNSISSTNVQEQPTTKLTPKIKNSRPKKNK